jgi:hypothetical protein
VPVFGWAAAIYHGRQPDGVGSQACRHGGTTVRCNTVVPILFPTLLFATVCTVPVQDCGLRLTPSAAQVIDDTVYVELLLTNGGTDTVVLPGHPILTASYTVVGSACDTLRGLSVPARLLSTTVGVDDEDAGEHRESCADILKRPTLHTTDIPLAPGDSTTLHRVPLCHRPSLPLRSVRVEALELRATCWPRGIDAWVECVPDSARAATPPTDLPVEQPRGRRK